MFDWNDLKYLLAVARHHSTLAASRALGVNQSTVQRRLVELEKRIGRTLVTRQASGYRLTEFGEELLPYAERVEAAVLETQQRIEAGRRDLTGVIRVTCPEPIMFRITRSGLLERFYARYPGLEVQFVMSDRYLDIMKGDADVALRSGDIQDGEDARLIGRKIADSLWAVYASRKYVAQHGAPTSVEALRTHPLIGFEEGLANHRAAVWLREVAPDAKMAARNNSVLGLVYAVKSGIGIAPLPTALGDSEEDLVRLFGPVPELTRIWRVLVHPDLRRTPRVAAFFDFIVEEIDALKAILTG